MNLSCNLYVDGEFEGTIHSNKDINIGKHGHIKGDIFSQRIIVQGFIEGNIYASRVEIKANGKVSGTVEYEELIIEAKGILDGNGIVKNTKSTSEKNQTSKKKS